MIAENQIRDFIRSYEYAANSHVFSNVLPFIHPHATYRFTDGDFIGIDSIRAGFESTWKNIQEEIYKLSDGKVITCDAESASVTYDFHWSGIVNGVPKSASGRGTNIIVRNGDALQFIHEHLSA